MRTVLFNLSRSGIDPEVLKLARQGAKRFPAGQEVYAFIDGKNFALATDYINFVEGVPKNSKERLRYLAKIHKLAEAVSDQKDFERMFDEASGWSYSS